MTEKKVEDEQTATKLEIDLVAGKLSFLRDVVGTEAFRDSFNDGGTFRDTFGDGGQWVSNFNNMGVRGNNLRHPAVRAALEKAKASISEVLESSKDTD